MVKKDQIIQSLCQEIIQHKNFFPQGTLIDTVYFGGGTPSILRSEELAALMHCIKMHFALKPDVECCLEANPDDLNPVYLRELKTLGINRLSIGIQSLHDTHLEWMNRSHTAQQALEVVQLAHHAGIHQISVDLIYGLPNLTTLDWEAQLDTVLSWPIQHLSAYSLTLEERTKYARLVSKGMYAPPDDERAVAHYKSLQKAIHKNGWEQYEVSNYCKDGNYSRHNTAYWQSEPYLGIGPSAHSYIGDKRRWNVASNAAYIQRLESAERVYEEEQLSTVDCINEYLLTGLRTKWGISRMRLSSRWNHFFTKQQEQFISEAQEKGWLRDEHAQLRLSSDGMLYADQISMELFADHSSQRS